MNNSVAIVLAGLASGVAAAVVVKLLTPGASPAPVPVNNHRIDTDPSVDLTPILERLDTIELELRAPQRVRVSETGKPVDLTGILDRLNDIERRVSELSQRVPDEEAEQLADDGLPEIFRGVSTNIAQDWRALLAVADTFQSQKSTSIPGVDGLTAPELVQRFGYPTRIGKVAGSDAVYVYYTPDNKSDGYVSFTFTGGRVSSVHADGWR